MNATLEQIKELREQTGVSMMNCKTTLTETNGDMDKAIEILRKKGEIKAASRSDRATGQGVVTSYIHSNNKLGVLLHLGCETDFVAKNEDFISLAKEIAMHIAASAPLYMEPSEVPEELIEKEKEIWRDLLKTEGKPEKMWDQIMEGKENKFRDEVSLLKQPFVKNPETSIEQLLTDSMMKIGENIKIEKFKRFAI